jgi:hypothetical protein
MNACPECEKSLYPKATRCSCGWIKSLAPAERDHRCQYQNNGRRCPLPGTICCTPYGSGPWYCSGHWRTLSDPQLAIAEIYNAEKNYQQILEDRIDWRTKLFWKGAKS